jgi:hypothetical protein
MSMATVAMDSMVREEDDLQYKALHTGALIAFVLGLLSVCVGITAANSLEWTLLVAPIPVVGIAFALLAMARIREYPEQYTGLGLARAGLVLSLVFLVGGLGYGGYVYATEVPDGYTRTSFAAMRPNEIQERGGVVVPPEVAALEGTRVFIKGYIRPDSISVPRGITRFLLVRDNNQCCFGDLSKINYYDQLDVTMTGGKLVDYSQGMIRMGGTLHIEPQNAGLGAGGVVFSLKADYAKN